MFRRLVFAAALAVALPACSEPPTKERQQADGAIAAARAAGAATYAKADLKTAESALSEYDAAVAQRDYRQALRLAIEARDGAYTAARHAADEKAAARSEAERLTSTLEALLKAASGRVSGGAGPKPTTRVVERLRVTSKGAQQTLQKSRSLMDVQDYAAAVALLSPVVEGLQRDLAPATAGRRGR
jgi:hypothetical protein